MFISIKENTVLTILSISSIKQETIYGFLVESNISGLSPTIGNIILSLLFVSYNIFIKLLLNIIEL